jgi:hypothetical protein
MERVAGIEPASSAWKAEVLPLNYTRYISYQTAAPIDATCNMVVGGGFEPPKLSRQIYSLIPLATREPHRKERRILLGQQPHVKHFLKETRHCPEKKTFD